MKKLPLWQRPLSAKKVLEVGGDPKAQQGVTHRVGAISTGPREKGIKFSEGNLENLPFAPLEKFDFVYVSNAFERLRDPVQAAKEINRITKKGYIETPSPLREQLVCPFPYDPSDFHTYFCWATPSTLHYVKKTADTVGQFPDSESGKLMKALFDLQRSHKLDLEPMLPRAVKISSLLFDRGLKILEHDNFHNAAAEGFCAYEASVDQLKRNLRFPLYLRSKRLQRLRGILLARKVL